MWITSGTISVTNGSDQVVGVGTTFLTSGVLAGYAFAVLPSVLYEGVLYEIESVESNTALTLVKPYAGSTVSGQPYKIVPTLFVADKTTYDKVLELLSAWSTAVTPNSVRINSPSVTDAPLSVAGTKMSFESSGSLLLQASKGNSTDNVSMTFMTGLSGRGRVGTFGNNNFALQSSVDGSTWVSALTIDNTNGFVTVPKGMNLNTGGGAPAGITNGSIWYDNGLGKLRCHQNGITTDVVGLTGGSVTSSTWALITGALADNALLSAALDGKQPIAAALTTLSSATAAFLALSDDADAAALRTTLGLGTAAVAASSAFEAAGNVATAKSEVTAGARALTPFAGKEHLLGRKATVLNMVAGGAAVIEDGALSYVGSIESLPGATFTRSSAALRNTNKRKIESKAAHQLRYQHDVNGTPQGVLYEASHAYLHPYSQPTVAQAITTGSPTDTTLSANWPGNWIAVGDNSSRRYVLQAVTGVSGQVYWISAIVQMTDGLAPTDTGSHTSSGWDFYPYFSGDTPLDPDTGSTGMRIEGPFADNVYRVSSYATLSISGSVAFGIDKLTGNSARTFKLGPVSFGPGRYPPSMFDNATGSPATRAADSHQVTLSGYTLHGGMTIFGEFTVPAGASNSYLYRISDGGSGFTYADITGGQLSVHHFTGSTFYTRAISGLSVGSTYKFAVSFDTVAEVMDFAVQSKPPAVSLAFPDTITFTPTFMRIGDYSSGLSCLNGPIRQLTIADKPNLAADLLLWVDDTESIQDKVGGMVDATMAYNDATNSLGRAALTGVITAPLGSNATSFGSFTKSAFNTALSDANFEDVDVAGKGTAALELVPAKLRGQGPFIIMDLIGDGVAESDGSKLSFSTVPARSTITRSSAALRGTGKRKIESVAASTLRNHHDYLGAPQGKLYEASATTLFPRSQPTISQLSLYGNLSDNAAPSGESGNWISVTTIGTTAYAYDEITLTSGDIVCMQQEIIMDDGNAPVPGNASTSGFDYCPLLQGSPSASLETTVVGPLSGNKYIVSSYRVISATGPAYFGWVKYNTQSAKNFKMGRRDIKIGRYPSSMIDNATGSPATRAADTHSVSLSGFTADEILFLAEFVVPPTNSNSKYVLATGGASSADRIEMYFSGSTTCNFVITRSSVFQFVGGLTGLVAGQKARVAALVSGAGKVVNMYRTGGGSTSFGLYGGLTTYTPPVITKIDPGNYYGANQLESMLGIAAIIDGGALPADVIAWVEDI